MAIDPVGSQRKIPSSEMNVRHQKLIDKKVGKLGGGFNTSSGTRGGKFSTSWEGQTKGKTKHTYGVNGNDDKD